MEIILPLQAVRQQYQNNAYQEDTHTQILVFEENKIVLDLPTGSSELKVVDDWKIRPLIYPQVKMSF